MKTNLISLVMVMGIVNVVSGQTAGPGYHPHAAWYAAPVFYHAATAEESWARGWASLLEAQGAYNEMTSRAMINATLAQRQQQANHMQAVQDYWIKKDLYAQRKQAEYQARRNLARSAHGARAAIATPNRSAPTGRIAWPAALQTDHFAERRAKVEQVVASNSGPRRLSPVAYMQMAEAIHAMLAQLDQQSPTLTPADYANAKQFLFRITSAMPRQG